VRRRFPRSGVPSRVKGDQGRLRPVAPCPLGADITGTGTPLVLIHGQPGSAAEWRGVTVALGAEFTVVAPDRLGYGRTGGPAGGFADNAHAVVALLDRLGIERAVVAGHSWGGGVAIALATLAPKRVAGLVLVASVGPAEPVRRGDRLLAIAPVGSAVAAVALGAAGRMLSLTSVRVVVDHRLRTPEADLARLADSWRRGGLWRSFVVEQQALVDELWTLTPALGAIAAPTTVVVGTSDHIVPAAVASRLTAAIPGARLVQIRGAGHLLPYEHPGTLALAVRDVAHPPGGPAVDPG
jgi:pimeloyl-ACP methyl ester carboxylesterase